MKKISLEDTLLHEYLIDMALYATKDEEDRRFIRELIRKMFKYHEKAFTSGGMPDTMAMSRYTFIMESLKADGILTTERGKKLNDLLKENKEN